VRMMARLRNLRRDVVDRDDAVEQHHDDENQQKQREIVQKRIATIASSSPACPGLKPEVGGVKTKSLEPKSRRLMAP
jgi:hypothetical protein